MKNVPAILGVLLVFSSGFWSCKDRVNSPNTLVDTTKTPSPIDLTGYATSVTSEGPIIKLRKEILFLQGDSYEKTAFSYGFEYVPGRAMAMEYCERNLTQLITKLEAAPIILRKKSLCADGVLDGVIGFQVEFVIPKPSDLIDHATSATLKGAVISLSNEILASYTTSVTEEGAIIILDNEILFLQGDSYKKTAVSYGFEYVPGRAKAMKHCQQALTKLITMMEAAPVILLSKSECDDKHRWSPDGVISFEVIFAPYYGL